MRPNPLDYASPESIRKKPNWRAIIYLVIFAVSAILTLGIGTLSIIAINGVWPLVGMWPIYHILVIFFATISIFALVQSAIPKEKRPEKNSSEV